MRPLMMDAGPVAAPLSFDTIVRAKFVEQRQKGHKRTYLSEDI